MYGKRRPMHTEPEPQRFQAIIQVWYKSGSSKANFFASKETAWLRQCASDFIALELPSPSQASSTCCSAECKIQVAWNVEAKDDLIRRLKTSFNPSTAVQRERGLTKEKLDSLEIYQMFLLKRWLKPSGDESLTGMGFARSSKATRDKHEASMANALPSTSFVLLTPTLPLEMKC
ncbi:hypothetical protein BT96DRAFT_129343 [Gymnopus androsaceus JB14]|uniref:Uncharacterized protein n=1 Tax=Gymnopus androsaceus JB14 TaxID=1447944 RepID=A0A6A4IE25_9AGAR|nr:hypothetical protein BT96DRAFT_129343 [Gymnopus androsaceus JB14]